VAWPTNVDHAESPLFDHTAQVNIDEVLTRCGAKVAEQSFLDVSELERNFQKWVGPQQVDLPIKDIHGELVSVVWAWQSEKSSYLSHRKIVGCLPVAVHQRKVDFPVLCHHCTVIRRCRFAVVEVVVRHCCFFGLCCSPFRFGFVSELFLAWTYREFGFWRFWRSHFGSSSATINPKKNLAPNQQREVRTTNTYDRLFIQR
jgi:hypothetical protein